MSSELFLPQLVFPLLYEDAAPSLKPRTNRILNSAESDNNKKRYTVTYWNKTLNLEQNF